MLTGPGGVIPFPARIQTGIDSKKVAIAVVGNEQGATVDDDEERQPAQDQRRNHQTLHRSN